MFTSDCVEEHLPFLKGKSESWDEHSCLPVNTRDLLIFGSETDIRDTCLQAKVNYVGPAIWYYLHPHIPEWNCFLLLLLCTNY